MRIERKRNLQRLINSRKNGQIKIITGIRRCGKSYLLGVLYRDYLLQEGIIPEQIITLELDNDANARYRNPMELGTYLRQMVGDTSKDYYITFGLYFNYSLISHVSTFILSEIEFYPLQTGVTLRYFGDFIPQIV